MVDNDMWNIHGEQRRKEALMLAMTAFNHLAPIIGVCDVPWITEASRKDSGGRVILTMRYNLSTRILACRRHVDVPGHGDRHLEG